MIKEGDDLPFISDSTNSTELSGTVIIIYK